MKINFFIFTAAKEYQNDLSKTTQEEKADNSKKTNLNKKMNPILYSLENSNQSYGNLKSSQMQKQTSQITTNNNPKSLNITETKEAFTAAKKPYTVSLANYTANESCINNPSFLKFMEKSNFNYYAANERRPSNRTSVYNEIQNLDAISDYYTKNLNLSSEEKLNIKNCILMQIINSSTTTLNLGDIGVLFFLLSFLYK